MNKKILIAIVPALLLLSGCQSNSTPSQTLKTYESAKYGLSFQYPSNWNVYDYENGNTNLMGITISPESEKTLLSKEDSVKVNITSFSTGTADKNEKDKEKILTDSWRKMNNTFSNATNAKVSEEKQIVIDNKKVIKVDAKNARLGKSCASPDFRNCVLANGSIYFFFHNGRGFKAGYNYPIEKEKDYTSVLEQIMLSLKFK
jgi:hypothetical protein